VSRQDRVQDGEERWQTIGTVRGMHVLVVAHTVEDDDNLIRIIISAKGNAAGENYLCAGLRPQVVFARRDVL
jgi:uncharacterized DUF497 family protein